MSVLLITIATGQVYRDYAIEMLASAGEFWPEARTLVFTDWPAQMQAHSACIHTDPKGYPQETLYRYNTMLKAQHILSTYDQLFYVDADMLFVAPVGSVYSDGLTATLHPGYIGHRGTPETRKESTAYCDNNIAYYCGGFQGGDSYTYLDAVSAMARNITIDEANGVMAVWHDESHWNKYLANNTPSKVLTPSYCYPEDYNGRWGWPKEKYTPILMALDKNKRGNHPRSE
jgi:histo-blood group ABO system transferase